MLERYHARRKSILVGEDARGTEWINYLCIPWSTVELHPEGLLGVQDNWDDTLQSLTASVPSVNYISQSFILHLLYALSTARY